MIATRLRPRRAGRAALGLAVAVAALGAGGTAMRDASGQEAPGPGAGPSRAEFWRLPADRAAAVAILAAEDRRTITPELERAAVAPDTAVRARAALALGRIGLPDGAVRLLELTRDPAAEVRSAAAFAIGLIDTGLDVAAGEALRARAAAALAPLLDDPSAGPYAAASLGAVGDAAALERWLGSAGDDVAPVPAAVPSTAAAAVAAWASLRGDRVGPLRRFGQSRDPAVRRATTAALAASTDPDRVPLLAGLLDDADRDVRVLALRALAFAPIRLALAHVPRFLGRGDGAEQCAALGWLEAAWRREGEGTEDGSAFTSVLRKSLDRDISVRRCALSAMGALPTRSVAIDRLLEALAEPEYAVRLTAMRALASAGPGIARLAVERLAEPVEPADGPGWLAGAAVVLRSRAEQISVRDLSALVAEGGPAGVAALQQLEQRDPQVAWRVARSALVAADPAVVAVAAGAIGRLGGLQSEPMERTAAADELWRALADGVDPAARVAAAESYARLAAEAFVRRHSLLVALPRSVRLAVRELLAVAPGGDEVLRRETGWLDGRSTALVDPEAVLDLEAGSSVTVVLVGPRGESTLELATHESPASAWRLLTLIRERPGSWVVQESPPGLGPRLAPPGPRLEWPVELLPAGLTAGGLGLEDRAGDERRVTLHSPAVTATEAASAATVLARVLDGQRAIARLQPGDRVLLVVKGQER